MAGSLRSYDMPNPVLAAKKRERSDAQDELWKSTGLEPIEDKAQEKAVQKASIFLQKKEQEKAPEKDIKSSQLLFLNQMGDLINNFTKDEIEGNLFLLELEKQFRITDAVFRNFVPSVNGPETLEDSLNNLKIAYEAYQQNVTPEKKDIALQKTIEFTENILQMGLSYLHDFVGMLGTRLADRDVRSYYKWKGKGVKQETSQSPLELEGVSSIEDFIRKNMHLGRGFCNVVYTQYEMILDEKKEEPTLGSSGDPAVLPFTKSNSLIGSKHPKIDQIFGFNIQATGDALDQFLKTSGIANQTGGFVHGTKKDWVFGLLDVAAFGHILSVGTMGAMSLAVGQIHRIPGCERFTLKQLLMSEGVRDVFAIFVAFQYLMSSGGNAYVGRTNSEQGKVKGTSFMISAGLETRKMLYAQIETAQYWFRDVYETTNPFYAQFENQKNELDSEGTNLLAKYNTKNDASGGYLLGQIDKASTILELDKLIKTNSTKSEAVAYAKNRRDIMVTKQLLEHLPKKILRHAN
jgi:hypothetical protein